MRNAGEQWRPPSDAISQGALAYYILLEDFSLRRKFEENPLQ